jgi:hypothetical protein
MASGAIGSLFLYVFEGIEVAMGVEPLIGGLKGQSPACREKLFVKGHKND